MGMGKIIIALAIIAAVIAAVFYHAPVRSFRDVVIQQLPGANSEIYSSLVAAGIVDALVDSTNERTIVHYALPDGVDKEASWYYVMGVIAAVAPETGKVILKAYEGANATEEIEIAMQDIQAFRENTITEQEFNPRIKNT